MADTTQFVLEGPMTLAYFSDERHSKRVLINPKEEDTDTPRDTLTCGSAESLEGKIASELGFPNDAEFDSIFYRMNKLREEGLRTEEGTPDGTREVQLRITVEVL